jgi:ATP-dependent DNA ligase
VVIPTPVRPVSLVQPFDDTDWLYEIKHDGFRALAVIEEGRFRFFSKNKHRLTGFRDVAEAIAKELKVDNGRIRESYRNIDLLLSEFRGVLNNCAQND